MTKNKNWTGNSNSIYKTLGASNHTEEERHPEDYYATDPRAAEMLLEIEKLDVNIIEPCVGEGHLAQVFLDKGYGVRAYDIIDRGFEGTIVADFLQKEFKEKFDADIVTNPPYKYAKHFVEKCLDVVSDGHKVCMFLKIQFLESTGRRNLFKKYPPKRVWVSSARITCAKNGDFQKMKESGGSAACYCWIIWEKGYQGETTLKWFN